MSREDPISDAIRKSPKCAGCGHSELSHRPMCVSLARDGGGCGCPGWKKPK